MFVFPRHLDHLSRFHCWVDLALLLNSSKKGVGREVAVLEVADNVFSNVHHSRKPVLIFCGRRARLQVTSPKEHSASRTFSWRVAPPLLPGRRGRWKKICTNSHKKNFFCGCWCKVFSTPPSGSERYTATTVWFSMAVVSREVSPRLALLTSVAPKKNNESEQADQIFKSSSTKFAPLVAKARWSVGRKGDWKDIAKLRAKYSSLDLPLPACAAALSFAATLFPGMRKDLQGFDGRYVSTQLSIYAEAFFFAQPWMFV